MTPRFAWTCSYLNMVNYRVSDATGTYEIEELRVPTKFNEDYIRSIYNGDYERERVPLYGHIYCYRGRPMSNRIPPETVAAFNAWRLEEHNRRIADLDRQPERYGIIAADDPIRTPPVIVRGAWYDGDNNRWNFEPAAEETATHER